MVTVPTKTLNSGYTVPVLGLGTWLSQPGEVGKAVEYAIKNGYRHIDCAYAYMNQKEVGEALSRVFAEKIVQVSV
uniref:NADP-dependent oxidoreductase domain-containing protein n=1 Tax=Parascaris equorum TaxID=6256 RepID=A0A914RC30_PAREQ